MAAKTRTKPDVNEDGLIVVHSKDEIPSHFATADDEAQWWETHELDPEAFPMRGLENNPRLRDLQERIRAARQASAESGTTAINIRIETDVLERLRKLASARGLGYQTLLKRFIVERLYEEEHHG